MKQRVCVQDSPGWGGVTLTLNLGSPEEAYAVTEDGGVRLAGER